MTDSPAFTIAKGTVPATTSTRTREANPFDGLFPTVGHGTPEQESLIIDLPSETEDEQKYVNKVASQAQTAARESKDDAHPSGYTARVKRTAIEVGTGKAKKVGTRLEIWSVERIFREGAGRKPAATPDAS